VSNINQIVHESETQRQFIRLQLPASAQIGEQKFTIKDLSSGGMALRDVGTDFKKGQTLDITLILPFADFSLDIDLKAEIQHIDKKIKTAGCRFIDLKQNQLSILNHVIRSFMSGDIMNGDDIINVVSRENFVNVRSHKAEAEITQAENIRKYSIYGLIALAIIIVSSFIIGNIMDRLLIVKTSMAQVYVPLISLSAPASGLYYSTIIEGVRTVSKGQIIARIKKPQTGQSIDVISPCDCYIAKKIMLPAQYIAEGGVLYTLIEKGAQTSIKAIINIEEIHRLNLGDDAVINISGVEKPITGTISKIEIDTNPPAPINSPPQGIAYISPKQPIPTDLYNRPAFVEFHL
jgi:hypothetical protein